MQDILSEVRPVITAEGPPESIDLFLWVSYLTYVFTELWMPNREGADDFEDFCLQSLFECVSTDRPGLLQVCMYSSKILEKVAG